MSCQVMSCSHRRGSSQFIPTNIMPIPMLMLTLMLTLTLTPI